jgi:hypothetical protein
LYAWELNLPNIPYLIKKKITVTNTIIVKNGTCSPSPINNLFIDQTTDYPKPNLIDTLKVIAYSSWTIIILSLLSIQPIHLFHKAIVDPIVVEEKINLMLLYFLIPVHYVWAKRYFSTNHLENFVLNYHWKHIKLLNVIVCFCTIVSLLSIVPFIIFPHIVGHYWSYGKAYFLITFATVEGIGRFIVLFNGCLFSLTFYTHLKQISTFIAQIESGHPTLNFNETTILSTLITKLVRFKSELNCSISLFEPLVSLTTILGGIATVMFVHHHYVNRLLTLSDLEIYTVIAIGYYILSQTIFFYILYVYSTKRTMIHRYINSYNFINKYIKRSNYKNSPIILIEEESATTLDWLILDRLIKDNWIEFHILGISTRDGTLVKKVITFAVLLYTLIKFF